MKITLTYKAERESLFGPKGKAGAAPLPIPKFANHKRYHIYVVLRDDNTEQKVDTSFTLEEAKAIIQYEREEDSDDKPFGDYAQQFKWIVKDIETGNTHTYNPTTRALELNIT